MRRAVGDLARLPDEHLFREVAEGIPLIVENAISLDETADRLHRQSEFRSSEILRGFAEEEAAKVLILIDLVRCPLIEERREETLERFYSHVAKRIYAMTCSYPRVASFREFRELVELEYRPYYLDGPNQFDWIFQNSISAEREETLYVDYVQEITEESSECYWRAPTVPSPDPGRYESPECIKLSRALSEAGANDPDGLAEIANIWRSFEPKPETDRGELRKLIQETLDRLAQRVRCAVDPLASRLIISCWSYPFWPLRLTKPPRKAKEIGALREQRRLLIEWVEKTHAKRDPRPPITRSRVEALSDAYSDWQTAVKARIAGDVEGEQGRFLIRSSEDIAKDFRLPAYIRLQSMFRELTEEERVALLALGWYSREEAYDWPKTYRRAIERAPTLNERYQIGLGGSWLTGLKLWEEKPRPFLAGRRFHTKR